MNEGDIANKSHEDTLDLIIAKRVKFDGESELECIDCDAEIPIKRRNLGGVKRCIYCQGVFEAKSKHYNRA